MKRRSLALLISVLLVFTFIAPTFPTASAANGTDASRYTVLVLDVSGSMAGQPIAALRTASKMFCESVAQAGGNNFIAIVTYETSARTICPFTDDFDVLQTALNNLRDLSSTNTNQGLEFADNLLSAIPDDPNTVKSILLLSDGMPNVGSRSSEGPYTYSDYSYYTYANAAYNTATTIKAKGVNIYTLGFFHSLSVSELPFARRFMNDLQSAGYYEAGDMEELLIQFFEISQDLLNPVDIFVSHSLMKTEDTAIDQLDGSTLAAFRYEYEIKAEIKNRNPKMVCNMVVHLDLPQEAIFAYGETANKTIPALVPAINKTVSWKIVIYRIKGIGDTNVGYTVAITSDNTIPLSQVGSIFVHGSTGNNILDFSRDTWKFSNYGETPIPIMTTDLRALKYGLSNSEKTFLDETVAGGVGGHCFGMAVTTSLAKVNRLDLNSLQSGATNLHMIDKTDRPKSAIAFYHLTQHLEPYQTHQEDFTAKSTTMRLQTIKALADAVDSGGHPFVLVFYGPSWGHAVNAYSFESGSFRIGGFLGIGGKVYDSRILIYDNNSPSWDEDYCLYFNEGTDEWTIPVYSDADYLAAAFEDINQMDNSSLDINKKNVRAALRAKVNTDLLIRLLNGGMPFDVQINQTDTHGAVGVRAYYDIGLASPTLNIDFGNNELPYLIQPQSGTGLLDLSVKYQNVYLSATSQNIETVTFDPNGEVGLQSTIGAFRVVLSGDTGHHPLPWYVIEITGEGEGDVSVSTAADGYFLKGDFLENIRIFAKNESQSRELFIPSGNNDIFICEIDGELAAFVDEKDEGTYDKEVAISDTQSTDEEKVEADTTFLTWDIIKGTNITQNDVTSNLTLPAIGSNGSTITWNTSDAATISTDGIVTRPDSSSGNQQVILVAVITSGDYIDSVTFILTVTAPSSNSGNTNKTYTITATAGMNGSISPSGTVTVPSRSSRTFTIKANNGFKVVDVLVDGRSVGAVETYIFSNVMSSHSISATFVKDEENIGNPDTPLAWLNPYDDVFASDWFYDAVQFATVEKLMNGTSVRLFSPNATTTRAMLVTVLYRQEGSPSVHGTIPFSDVKGGEWYSNAILWATQNDIVNGYSNGTFGLNDPVTREQAVTILYRYAKAKGMDVNASADLSRYADMNEISDWALDAMKWAVAVGLIQGRTATTIVPQGISTRAEVAMIFKRFVEDFLSEGGDLKE